MSLITSMYNGVSTIGSTMDYYWQYVKHYTLINYYYYFQQGPARLVYVTLDESKDSELQMDELGNSVFVADDINL